MNENKESTIKKEILPFLYEALDSRDDESSCIER